MTEPDIERVRQQAVSVKKLPVTAQKLIRHYQALRIHGLSIVCPYHINAGLYAKKRALVGKGRPEEIEVTAEHYLAKYKLHAHGDSEQLRAYLRACGIGIDCSGFVAWVLDCVTEDRLHKSIWHCLAFPGAKRRVISRLRPLENISANLLTGARNARKITNIQQVRPGDMIRLIEGSHVMVITEVGLDKKGHVLYFEYAQSSVTHGTQQGVDTDTVLVTRPARSLGEQLWDDQSILKELAASSGNASIVRLKALL